MIIPPPTTCDWWLSYSTWRDSFLRNVMIIENINLLIWITYLVAYCNESWSSMKTSSYIVWWNLMAFLLLEELGAFIASCSLWFQIKFLFIFDINALFFRIIFRSIFDIQSLIKWNISADDYFSLFSTPHMVRIWISTVT